MICVTLVILTTQDPNNPSLCQTACHLCHLLSLLSVFSLCSEEHCISCFVLFRKLSSFQVDYTGVDMSSPCFTCSQNFSWNSTRPCTCSIPFYLDQPYEVTVAPYVTVFSSLTTACLNNLSLVLLNNRAASSCITASPTSTRTTVATSSQEMTAS